MGQTEQEQGFVSDLLFLQMERQRVREVTERFKFIQLSAGLVQNPGFLAPSVTWDMLPTMGCSARWAPSGPGPSRNAEEECLFTRLCCKVLVGFLVASLVTDGRKTETF